MPRELRGLIRKTMSHSFVMLVIKTCYVLWKRENRVTHRFRDLTTIVLIGGKYFVDRREASCTRTHLKFDNQS